jgi:serine/threonine protein kinase
MNHKTPNLENFKINKLPLVPNHNFNQRHNINNKKNRNNSKKISEKNNIGKLSGSYQSKTNYKFKLSSLVSTIEVNKNTSGNDSYQYQMFPNPSTTNEKPLEMQEGKEKLTVNKTNLRGIKTKLDKNKSFVIRSDKREMSFNKRDVTPTLLKHISIRSKNISNNSHNNKYYKHLESNSAFSLLESNLKIKPSYLQYDFEKYKLKRNDINSKFININNNALENIDKEKNENNKNNMNIKENLNTDNTNNNNIVNNLKNINNKNKGNINNLFIKINNNISKMNSNKHYLHLNSQNLNNTDEYFYESEQKEISLTKEEKTIFGNRMMKNYYKKKLLGKGGCGIVWQCYKNDLNDKKIDTVDYAVKQVSKKSSNNPSLISFNITEDNLKIARNEIKILKKLNEKNVDNDNEKKGRICEVIPKIYEFYEDSNDIWFSFEKGGKSLSSLSYKIKGEFEKGERIYNIQKGIFLKLLFINIKQFKSFIKKILLGIDFINNNGIIHSDIKPENILIEYNNDDNFEINSIKIIDYGSAFYYENTSSISSNTPEYLCPEITNGNKKFLKNLCKEDKKYINCIDIWSFGVTLLELCLCCPIWMSYKSKISINGKSFYSLGYFGCRGRDGNKIYQKQIELSKNLNKILKNSLLYLLNKDDKEKFINLLSKMLEFDYKKRIKIKDAINHDFLNEEENE